MTLLGAIPSGNDIVVLADGASHDVSVENGVALMSRESVVKLWQVRDEPLVWGFAGEGATGQPFGEWLIRQPLDDWATLAQTAGRTLHEINLEANKKMAAYAQVVRRPCPSVASMVLIAGFVGGEGDALKINAEGMAVRLHGRKQLFLGSGEIQAVTAWQVINDLFGEQPLYDPLRIRSFFASLVEHVGGLDGDVRTWVVTAVGASELRATSRPVPGPPPEPSEATPTPAD